MSTSKLYQGRRCTQPCVLRMRVYHWPWSAVLPAFIPEFPMVPPDPPGHPMIPWSGVLGTKGRHTCVPTPLSKSWDDLVTLGSPTTMRPALWGVRVAPPKQSSNKSSVGDTPPIEVSNASVLHIGRHPPPGGFPPVGGQTSICRNNLSFAGIPQLGPCTRTCPCQRVW